MRLLLVDHGCCDPPDTRVHRLRLELERSGVDATACGPSTVPSLAMPVPGLHGIHLHDVAAANRRFLAAVHDGSAAALLTATATLSPRLLGLVRETARQALAEAVDARSPDAILVLHAGILADLAIETGVPVALHVAAGDLAAAAAGHRVDALVAAAVGSAEWLGADSIATRRLLETTTGGATGDAGPPQRAPRTDCAVVVGPLLGAGAVIAACQAAIATRARVATGDRDRA